MKGARLGRGDLIRAFVLGDAELQAHLATELGYHKTIVLPPLKLEDPPPKDPDVGEVPDDNAPTLSAS